MAVTNSGGFVVEQGTWGPADLQTLREIYAPLRRFAAVIGQPDVEPDDLVQEAFARVLRIDPSTIDDTGAYLRRTVANLATDSRRRAARAKVALARSTEVADSPDAYPSDLADLMRLDPSVRVLLFMVEVEGLQIAEAARSVGMSSSAARVALMRARRRLRSELSAELADE